MTPRGWHDDRAFGDVGIYIYEWIEHNQNGKLNATFAHLVQMPVHKRENEVQLLLYKKHFCLIKNFRALMGEQGVHKGKKQNAHTRKYCHRCSWHTKIRGAAGDKALQEHLAGCNPWEEQQPPRREVFLPERTDGIAPTIKFRKYEAMHDVPCYVVFDMENYSQGYSNKAVLSFGFAAVGSELYEVPERFRYRQFINRDPDADLVSCVIEAIGVLQELCQDLREASQAHPHPRLT